MTDLLLWFSKQALHCAARGSYPEGGEEVRSFREEEHSAAVVVLRKLIIYLCHLECLVPGKLRQRMSCFLKWSAKLNHGSPNVGKFFLVFSDWLEVVMLAAATTGRMHSE